MASVGVGILEELMGQDWHRAASYEDRDVHRLQCLLQHVFFWAGLPSPGSHYQLQFFCSTKCWLLMHFLVPPSHPPARWNLNVSTALLGFCSCSYCNVLSGNQQPQSHRCELGRKKKRKIVWSDCSHFYMGEEALTLILIYLLICKYAVHTVE